MQILVQSEVFDKDNEPLIDFVLRNVRMYSFLPDDLVIKQGDQPSDLYFLQKGECVVEVKDQFKK